MDLAGLFSALHGAPGRTYLIGASEGSLVTALTLERDPQAFDAGLAACGTLGDFQASIDYACDVRVVFDYLFPRVIPGSVADVTPAVRRDWEAVHEPHVRQALMDDPARLDELLAVTRMAVDPEASPEAVLDTIAGLLWFATFGSGDLVARLGGHPFGNRFRVYRGSTDDAALNRGVGRHVADPGAVAEIATRYEASGRLSRPLVTLHSRLDPIVPYRQDRLFARKVRAEVAGALHGHVPGDRFGHCAFDVGEMLVAFAKMVHMTNGALPRDLEQALSDGDGREHLMRRLRAAQPPSRP